MGWVPQSIVRPYCLRGGACARRVSAAILAFLLGGFLDGRVALATTCLECSASAVLADCTPLRYGEVVPLDLPLTVAASCEERSCAPPIPPDTQPTCGVLARRVDPGWFVLHSPEQSLVEGQFLDTGSKCGDASLLAYDRAVPSGRNWVFSRVWGCTSHPLDQIIYPPEAILVFTDQELAGDCDGSGVVTIEEVVVGVNLALDDSAVFECRLVDADDDGTVGIDELVMATRSRLASALLPSGTPPR